MPPEGREGGGGNLLSLGLSQVFRLGSGLAINVMLMRALGVEGFGVYGYITTLVGLASFGAGLSMNKLINRELARDPSARGRLVGTGLAATGLLSLVTSLGLMLWIWAVDGRASVMIAGGIAAVALTCRSLSVVPESAFHAAQRMGPSVRAQVVGRVVLVLATALFLWTGQGVAAVFAAQVLDGAATLGLMLLLYRRHLGAQGMRTAWSEIRSLVRRSVPFGLNAMFGSIYLAVDVLLLALICDDAEVGIYRGAVMLITLFPVVATTLTTGFFPRMARHLGDRASAGAELAFLSRVLLAVSVPAAVGGMLTARPLMVLLGGEEFAASALPFVIMAPLLPLRFLNNGFAMTLSCLDRQEDRTRGVALAAAVNFGANLLLIPSYGALGAAATTLGTEVLLLAWNRWRIQDLVTGLGIGASLVRVGLPAAVMAAAVLALPEVHVLVQVAVGAVVYVGAGLPAGAYHPRDLSRLRRV